MKAISIYDYETYTSFLDDYCCTRKSHDRNFSMRWLSKRAKIKSPTLLRMILAGERKATLDTVTKLNEAMKLNPRECKIAICLAEVELDRSQHIRTIILKELDLLKGERRHFDCRTYPRTA